MDFFFAIFSLNAAACWVVVEYLSLLSRRIERNNDQNSDQVIKARLEKLAKKIDDGDISIIIKLALKIVILAKDKLFSSISPWFSRIGKSDKIFPSILYTILAIAIFFVAFGLVSAAMIYPECQTFWGFEFCYPNSHDKTYFINLIIILSSISCAIIIIGILKERRNSHVDIFSFIYLLLFVSIPVSIFVSGALLVVSFSLNLGLWLSIVPLSLLSVLLPKLITEGIAIALAPHPPTEVNYEGIEEDIEMANEIRQEFLDESGGYFFAFFLAFFAGFILSWLAMIFGQIFSPIETLKLPLNLPMLLINSTCDGLTLSSTIYFISLAMKSSTLPKTILLLLLNLTISLLFALASISLGSGYEGSEKFTLVESYGLLFPMILNNSSVQLNSYFFLMNSTLIPVFFYSTIVLLLITVKISFYRPLHFFFRKAKADSKPLELMIDGLKVLRAASAFLAATLLVLKLL